MSESVYEIITSRVIESLKNGVVPWKKPWSGESEPCNFITKRAYSGLNLFLLNANSFSSRYFLTYLQVSELGGKIRKNEHATPIIFWKMFEKQKSSEEKLEIEKMPVLRYYNVFNADQIEGIDFSEEVTEERPQFTPIEKAEAFIKNIGSRGPQINLSEIRKAYYHKLDDFIHLPSANFFEKSEEFYNVLFHELTHSTGHLKRLDRKTLVDALHFGDNNYSKEELVAEMGATFLCSHCDILEETFNNSASYINGWISKLKSNPKLIVEASSQAQKAVNYLLGD